MSMKTDRMGLWLWANGHIYIREPKPLDVPDKSVTRSQDEIRLSSCLSREWWGWGDHDPKQE